MVDGEGRRESRKGRVRGRKNKPKKSKNLFAKKKKPRKEKNVLTPNLFPSPEKVIPQRKAGFAGGVQGCLSGLGPVLRHIDLAGKVWLVQVFANCWK